MLSIQTIIDALRETPPELRRAALTNLGADSVREAWSSCGDAGILANLASLLLPKAVVASGLAACIRDLLLQLDLGKSPLMGVVAATNQSPDDKVWMAAVERAMETLGAVPPVESAEYDAYGAIINLHKFLFFDEAKGIQGVIFFCVESTVSKEYPTWDGAGQRVAQLFRDEVSDFIDGVLEIPAEVRSSS